MKKLSVKARVLTGALLTVSLSLGTAGVSVADTTVSSNNDDVEVTQDYLAAAEDYQPGNAGDVAELAVSAADMVDGEEAVETVGSEDAQSLVSVDGADDPVHVDGVDVYADVDTDLDVVHQTTGEGERFIAVLGSEEAPSEQVYDFDLPDGAELELQRDGSIEISVTTTEEVALPGEEERIEEAAAAVFGKDTLTFEDLENATDEQIDALAAIPDEKTETVETTEVIGEVEAPWAVDAEGNELETYYEIEDGKIVQTVITDEDTVYPVVADPNIAWWVWTASKCLAGVATLVAFGPGKVATVAAKVYKILKAGKTSKVRQALANWNYLGKNNSQRFQALVYHVKRFASDLKNTRDIKRSWARMSSTKAGDQSKKFILNAGTTVIDIIGLKSCYSLYTNF